MRKKKLIYASTALMLGLAGVSTVSSIVNADKLPTIQKASKSDMQKKIDANVKKAKQQAEQQRAERKAAEQASQPQFSANIVDATFNTKSASGPRMKLTYQVQANFSSGVIIETTLYKDGEAVTKTASKTVNKSSGDVSVYLPITKKLSAGQYSVKTSFTVNSGSTSEVTTPLSLTAAKIAPVNKQIDDVAASVKHARTMKIVGITAAVIVGVGIIVGLILLLRKKKKTADVEVPGFTSDNQPVPDNFMDQFSDDNSDNSNTNSSDNNSVNNIPNKLSDDGTAEKPESKSDLLKDLMSGKPQAANIPDNLNGAEPDVSTETDETKPVSVKRTVDNTQSNKSAEIKSESKPTNNNSAILLAANSTPINKTENKSENTQSTKSSANISAIQLGGPVSDSKSDSNSQSITNSGTQSDNNTDSSESDSGIDDDLDELLNSANEKEKMEDELDKM